MNTQIANNRQDFERKVARIRSNPDLNDEARGRMIGEAYEEADARHRQLAEDQRRQENERVLRLERAERSGDPRLAEAVYHVATERGLRGVADSYLEGRPAERKKWEEYAAARREAGSAERLLFGTGDHGPIKPAELDGYAVRAPSSDAASG
jgi:hypothetical protein